MWLTEYVRWCQAFDDYNTHYKKWTCMKVNVIVGRHFVPLLMPTIRLTTSL